jgi:hypothetical protein
MKGHSGTPGTPGTPGPRNILTLANILLGLSVLVAAAFQPAASFRFERVVAPFSVLDDRGQPYAQPFLGGLDVPRPQFVDIDGDDDLDLFLQEYSNQLWFFENTGSAKAPAYTWRTDRYQDVEIGEWYRFVDLDADGDFDLVSELPFSLVRHYRNAGSRTEPRLQYVGPLKDAEGKDIFIDRQNIPAFVDIDCDQRLDFFVGRVEGTITRYETAQPGGDRFEFIQEQFEGIEIIGRGFAGSKDPASFGFDRLEAGSSDPARPSSRHGANALAFADFDGDKDFDLFWGDFFEAGMLLIENIGRTCSSPSFQVEPVQLPFALDTLTSGYNAPAPVDLDRDGDLDVLMGVLGGAFNPINTAADNFYHWERTSPDKLELRTRRFLNGIDLGSETQPALTDLDADGDLDLIVGTKIDPKAADSGRLAVFMNEGTKAAPRFRWTETLKLTDALHLAPALGDLDADGDPDLLVGTWNQGVLVFRNTGSAKAPVWTADPSATIQPARASFATPALADIDGDKDLDLFVGQASGAVVFYRNTGTARTPRFELVSERIDDLRPGRRTSPALVDVDADGRLDLVVGREEPGAAIYRHAGSVAMPKFVEMTDVTLALPAMATPAFGDLDADGRVDLLAGTYSGGVVFLRRR